MLVSKVRPCSVYGVRRSKMYGVCTYFYITMHTPLKKIVYNVDESISNYINFSVALN